MKISIIGTGNVATHLSLRFHTCNISIRQIYSRTLKKAQTLAQQVQAIPINNLKELNTNIDLILLAVSDGAIESVVQTLANFHENLPLIVHTSGATPSTIFKKYVPYYGIFYPLQTFSIAKQPDFSTLPICIDAANKTDLAFLEQLAHQICPNVYKITDRERATLHVCAVMVNNFTNHLYAIAEDILEKENIAFDILKPLIQETVDKIQHHPAKEMQTGPAIRKDEGTIQKHLAFLENYPQYQMLYQMLSESIQQNG